MQTGRIQSNNQEDKKSNVLDGTLFSPTIGIRAEYLPIFRPKIDRWSVQKPTDFQSVDRDIQAKNVLVFWLKVDW